MHGQQNIKYLNKPETLRHIGKQYEMLSVDGHFDQYTVLYNKFVPTFGTKGLPPFSG
jgi:hypothetical protein